MTNSKNLSNEVNEALNLLGCKVRDVITKQEGIVQSVHVYFGNEVKVVLSPSERNKQTGGLLDLHLLTLAQIEVVDPKPVATARRPIESRPE